MAGVLKSAVLHKDVWAQGLVSVYGAGRIEAGAILLRGDAYSGIENEATGQAAGKCLLGVCCDEALPLGGSAF